VASVGRRGKFVFLDADFEIFRRRGVSNKIRGRRDAHGPLGVGHVGALGAAGFGMAMSAKSARFSVLLIEARLVGGWEES